MPLLWRAEKLQRYPEKKQVFSQVHREKGWGIRRHGRMERFILRGKLPATLFSKDSQTNHCPLQWRHSLCQTQCNSSETARVIVLILKECLVNFSQGVDPSKIDNFLLYLYSSE